MAPDAGARARAASRRAPYTCTPPEIQFCFKKAKWFIYMLYHV